MNATVGVDAPANSSNTVLSVNDDGDVILVDGGGPIGSCLGNGPSPLTANAGIALGGNSFYFDGQTTDEKVGIGIPCGNTINAKLEVINTITTIPTNSNKIPLAGRFENTGTGIPGIAIGVLGRSDVLSARENIGGYFDGQNANSINYGVFSRGTGGIEAFGGSFSASNATNVNYGIRGIGGGTTTNVGGYFISNTGTLNIGVYGSVSTTPGGPTTGPADLAGLFNGPVFAFGSITQNSDINLKENITSIDNALDKLSKIKPTQYNFKTTPYLALPGGQHFGIIAQDLETVFPNLVSEAQTLPVLDSTGTIIYPSQTYKGINYIELIPISIKAINELNLIVSKQTLSDAVLKQNVQPLQNSLAIVSQLNGVNYSWNQSVDTTLNLPAGTEVGLIAQDVETVVPEVVYTDDKGYKHVEYQKLVPHLIEANKQLKDSLTNLQSQLSALNQQVASIQNCLNNLGCGGNNTREAVDDSDGVATEEAVQKIELGSVDQTILYQNEPNPFSENTVIRYYLPEDAEEAVLIFHDEYGRKMGREVLSSKGYAKVEINSEKLAAGVYTYSLIVNGNLIATKKMIKVRN